MLEIALKNKNKMMEEKENDKKPIEQELDSNGNVINARISKNVKSQDQKMVISQCKHGP